MSQPSLRWWVIVQPWTFGHFFFIRWSTKNLLFCLIQILRIIHCKHFSCSIKKNFSINIFKNKIMTADKNTLKCKSKKCSSNLRKTTSYWKILLKTETNICNFKKKNYLVYRYFGRDLTRWKECKLSNHRQKLSKQLVIAFEYKCRKPSIPFYSWNICSALLNVKISEDHLYLRFKLLRLTNSRIERLSVEPFLNLWNLGQHFQQYYREKK